MQTRQRNVLMFSLMLIAATVGSAAHVAVSPRINIEHLPVQRYLYAATILDDGEEEGGIDLTSPDVIKRIRIINLGPVVNTPSLDYAPTVTADGKTLYFVSDRPGSTPNKDGDPTHDFWAAKKLENLDTNFFHRSTLIQSTHMGLS